MSKNEVEERRERIVRSRKNQGVERQEMRKKERDEGKKTGLNQNGKEAR